MIRKFVLAGAGLRRCSERDRRRIRRRPTTTRSSPSRPRSSQATRRPSPCRSGAQSPAASPSPTRAITQTRLDMAPERDGHDDDGGMFPLPSPRSPGVYAFQGFAHDGLAGWLLTVFRQGCKARAEPVVGKVIYKVAR